MKVRVLKSIGVIILIIILGLIFSQVDYSTSQEYSKIAADQLNDDTAYNLLKTKAPLFNLYKLLCIVGMVSISSLFYFIWKPKK